MSKSLFIQGMSVVKLPNNLTNVIGVLVMVLLSS